MILIKSNVGNNVSHNVVSYNKVPNNDIVIVMIF